MNLNTFCAIHNYTPFKQSVCLMICANSWLSTARHKSVTSFNFLMTYLIRMVACGIFIMVLLQITSFLPQYSPKAQVESNTAKSWPLSFRQKFLSYFTSSDASQKQEIERNKMSKLLCFVVQTY